MAVTNNGLITASGSAEATELRGVRRSFTRTYQLTSTSVVTDDENAVMTAVGIALYSVHPSYAAAWATSIKVDLQEVIYNGVAGPNGAIWHATVEYGWLDPLLRGTSGNALNAPITWSVQYEEEEEVLYEDIHGDDTATPATAAGPIVNAAGDYFDPPVTIARQRGVLSVNVNVGTMDVPTLDSWGNCVNAAGWNSFPAKTVLLLPIEIPERQYDEATDTVFWPLTFRFRIRNPETWAKVVLNQGFRELHTTTGTTQIQRSILIDGIPATSPVLLDEDGHTLPIPVAPADVVYLEFDVYRSLDFGVLGLDSIPDFPTS